ncbi:MULTISPECIES: helix-turn-helix domain-containing protein [Amycolatopsis]|uniref:Helix-turn-helix domain-containing protein n=1 Tax=Amycolatopsis thermalba TaxID=944492 RepID=A0ABY4NY27_9PSEU|nr:MULTISPECIES: helix-turn-helix domain-containing protein [Amycolatopsis]OXM74877.1 AraC family transcriptional regulator [Amycolatopsis sp. KNN50.9b]UQS24942.1 helix-turn-helix domain-containing protein [Amycolatopsis thermalba]
MTRVGVVVVEGTSLFELGAPCSVFGTPRPEVHDPWYEFVVCAESGAHVGDGWLQVSGSGTAPLEGLVDLDTVIVPPLQDSSAPSSPALASLLREAHRNGARIASICTGAFTLAEAGLLDGLRATTHWLHAGRLAREFPAVEVVADVLYVDNGQILTSAGKAAGLDLCLHMLRCDLGSEVANAVARRLVAPPHRQGGQAQYIETPVPAADGHGLGTLLDWARANLHQPITVATLAARFHVSPRHLTRLFRATTGLTPLHWLHLERIRQAQRLLEDTDAPLEHIAARVGTGTAATLRRHFTRTIGTTPSAYREAFRTPSAAAG